MVSNLDFDSEIIITICGLATAVFVQCRGDGTGSVFQSAVEDRTGARHNPAHTHGASSATAVPGMFYYHERILSWSYVRYAA